MWKAVVGHNVSVKVEAQGDDWDTDPDFVNDISEREQRWGAKTIEGSGRAGYIDIHELRNKVSEEHEVIKKKELETGPKASYGYGGKFGTERDRMDKCAVGHEYIADVGKHSSQTDAAQGFGGKFGVQRDRADKSALGFEYKGEVEKHSSQKGKSTSTCGPLTLCPASLLFPVSHAVGCGTISCLLFQIPVPSPSPLWPHSLLSCHHPHTVHPACLCALLWWKPHPG